MFNETTTLQRSDQSKKFSPKQRIAIEFIALNPAATKKEIANHVGVVTETIYDWQKEPYFVEAIYERYMMALGFQLPAVLQAMVREAIAGNVQAGRLILEHSGKLVKNVHIQVDSPFEKFLKAEVGGKYEDAEIIEAEYELDKLPVRDESNNKPYKRKRTEKKKLKRVLSKGRKKANELKARRERYALRERAKKVGLKPLPPGRLSKGKRSVWIEELKKLEATSSSASSSS